MTPTVGFWELYRLIRSEYSWLNIESIASELANYYQDKPDLFAEDCIALGIYLDAVKPENVALLRNQLKEFKLSHAYKPKFFTPKKLSQPIVVYIEELPQLHITYGTDSPRFIKKIAHSQYEILQYLAENFRPNNMIILENQFNYLYSKNIGETDDVKAARKLFANLKTRFEDLTPTHFDFLCKSSAAEIAAILGLTDGYMPGEISLDHHLVT